MTKENPEKNDIFTDGTHKIRVDEESGDQAIRFYFYELYNEGEENREYVEVEIISLEDLMKYEYLGKAKERVSNLFKTENE